MKGNIYYPKALVNGRSGFTFIEVLIAVAIAGASFGAFLLLSSKTTDLNERIFKSLVETVATHNCLNEIIYGGKSFNNETVEVLNVKIPISQDFTSLMGFRLVKVKGGEVTLYETR